jgi:hypothetical protein
LETGPEDEINQSIYIICIYDHYAVFSTMEKNNYTENYRIKGLIDLGNYSIFIIIVYHYLFIFIYFVKIDSLMSLCYCDILRYFMSDNNNSNNANKILNNSNSTNNTIQNILL